MVRQERTMHAAPRSHARWLTHLLIFPSSNHLSLTCVQKRPARNTPPMLQKAMPQVEGGGPGVSHCRGGAFLHHGERCARQGGGVYLLVRRRVSVDFAPPRPVPAAPHSKGASSAAEEWQRKCEERQCLPE